MNNISKTDSFDALLYLAARDAGQKDLLEYYSMDEEVPFSRRFERRMEKFLRKERYKASPFILYCKRVAVVFLVIMSVAFTMALGVEAVRDAIWNTILTFFEKYVTVSYDTPEEEQNGFIFEYKDPGQIADGYEVVYEHKGKARYTKEYQKGVNKISYKQYTLDTYYSNLSYDESKVKEITVNGTKGIVIEHSVEGVNATYIVWRDTQYAYVLTGNISREELIRAAENIK